MFILQLFVFPSAPRSYTFVLFWRCFFVVLFWNLLLFLDEDILKYFVFSLQDWFAFLGNGSEFNFTLVGEAFFPNTGNPTADDNYGFCQVSVFDLQMSAI